MYRSMQAMTTMLLAMLCLASAEAQDEAMDEEAPIQRYTVEVIIFKYLQDVSSGSEVFPADRPAVDALPLDNASDTPAASPPEPREPVSVGDPELVPLAADQFTLTETRRRLELLDVYDPLVHFGWTQAAWPEEQTRPISLGSMVRLPDGLDGELTLYLGRYLHLVVDLALDGVPPAPERAAPFERAGGFSDGRMRDEREETAGFLPVRYRINEDRILRNGETRYFDHPKFGVLAKVSRVAEDEGPQPETDPS